MEKIKQRSECPLSYSLDIFGDKWSLLIIRDMMFFKKTTYGEFLKSPEGIATNILASRLQSLEENKLIKKLEHPDSKAKILYKPTQKAIELLPIMVETYLWADKYFDMAADIKAIIKEAKQDKNAFIERITKKLQKQVG